MPSSTPVPGDNRGVSPPHGEGRFLRGFAPARRGPFVSAKGPKTMGARARPFGGLCPGPVCLGCGTRFAQTVLAPILDSGPGRSRARRRPEVAPGAGATEEQRKAALDAATTTAGSRHYRRGGCCLSIPKGSWYHDILSGILLQPCEFHQHPFFITSSLLRSIRGITFSWPTSRRQVP